MQKTIRLFCTLFEDMGAPRPSAETLRMAKFNKEEAVEGMWSLLGQLIVLFRYLFEKRIPRACSSAISWNCVEKSEILHSLYACGYRRVKLFALCSVSASARELLLAFAWMLSHMRFFERLQHCYVDNLNADAVPCRPQERGLLAARDRNAATFASSFSALSIEDCEMARLLAGLHQQVESAARLSLSSEQALIRRTHAIHRHTLSAVKAAGAHGQVKAPHLTVHEAYLLRHPKLLEEHLRVMEFCTQGLANLLEWKQNHEQLFWQWMDSVVGLESATYKASGTGDSSTSPQEPPQESGSTATNVLSLPTCDEVHSVAQEEWSTTGHQYQLAEPYLTHRGKGSQHRNTVQPSNTECPDEALVSLHSISHVVLVPEDMKDAKKTTQSLPSSASSVTDQTASLAKQKEELLEDIRELRQQAARELDLLCSQHLPKGILPYKPVAGCHKRT